MVDILVGKVAVFLGDDGWLFRKLCLFCLDGGSRLTVSLETKPRRKKSGSHKYRYCSAIGVEGTSQLSARTGVLCNFVVKDTQRPINK